MRGDRVMVLLFVLLAGRAAGADFDPMAARLDAVLKRPSFRGARVGALVVTADGGDVLYSRNADTPLAPASNQKILTATAALATFGPAYQFVTRVYADQKPDETGAVQTLAVRGGGDPALTSEDWWRLAADLRRRGLRRVRGDLVLDDSLFDRERWNAAWGPVASRAYHSPVGALSANYGSFAIDIAPGSAVGATVYVGLDPPIPSLRLRNRAQTGAARGGSTLQIGRRSVEGADEVEVSGVVPAGGAPELYYRSVGDPTRYAGEVFRLQLQANGIAMDGGMRAGAVLPGWQEILAFEGRPLAEIVRLLMKYSNNGIAESLLKSMGAQLSGGQGGWENGLAALRARLIALGLDATGAVLVDGSGLSRENRVTARLLVSALRLARASYQFGPEFVAALPIGGLDGTLQHRAEAAGPQVRAKTGLLNQVTALSGYARSGQVGDLVFSVLLNGYECGDAEAMNGLDAFAAAAVGRDAGGQ